MPAAKQAAVSGSAAAKNRNARHERFHTEAMISYKCLFIKELRRCPTATTRFAQPNEAAAPGGRPAVVAPIPGPTDLAWTMLCFVLLATPSARGTGGCHAGAIRTLPAASAYPHWWAGGRTRPTCRERPSSRHRAPYNPAFAILSVRSAAIRFGVPGGGGGRMALRADAPPGNRAVAIGAVGTGPRTGQNRNQEQGERQNPHSGSIGGGAGIL